MGIQSKGQACYVAAAFRSLDLNNSPNIMPSSSLHWHEENSGRYGAKREQISAEDFYVFEHIHNQLTCAWLDRYLCEQGGSQKELGVEMAGLKEGGKRGGNI